MQVNHMKMPAFLRMSQLAACVGLVAAMAVSQGCASPEEIDRVQPDLIKKTDLEGEWYSLGTITRAPYASAAAFPGLQGSLERGVWRVEQNQLYFYRTYEVVEGVEGPGIRADVDVPLRDKDGEIVRYEKARADGSTYTVTRYEYRSAPIKRFNILGHFDVRQSYNPMTGEAANVRVEDSSEKMWYERAWMRIDFSSNSANNFADVSFWSSPMNEMFANFSIYEGDEGPEDIQIRVQDEGNYMDFVVRGFITAPREFLGGWGWVPACLFYPWYQGAFYECDEEEIHVRTSFQRVPETNTYKALDWNDHLMNKFGYYRSARSFFDERYGQTWTGAERPIRRFRVWNEYLVNEDGTLDYANMTPKPVVYYLSEDFPRELIPGAKDLANGWNTPFSQVVLANSGKTDLGQFTIGEKNEPLKRMFVLCENNQAEVEALLAANPDAILAETDPAYCKDMDRRKLIGDLRYNLLASLNEPVQYGLYGYGPMNSDPLTGETIHANAFMYTGNIRQGARTAVDMIEYAAGVQDFVDITQARHIETRLKARQLKGAQNAPKTSRSLESLQASAMQAVPATALASLSAVGLGSTEADIASARMQRLLGTKEFNGLWINEDMAALAGMPVHQLGSITGAQADDLDTIANPANLGSQKMLTWQFERDMEMGKHAMCKKEFFDDSFRGFALEKKKFYDDALCTKLEARAELGDDMAFNFSAFKEASRACDTDPTVCGANEVCKFLDQGEVSGNFCVAVCSAQALFTQLRQEIRRVNQISQFAYWDPNALYTDTRDARVSAAQIAAREVLEEVRTEVFLDVYDRMWSTIGMHEVGHNVGLRHNFASSTDALNYFEDYWDYKGGDTGTGWEPDTLFTSDTSEQVQNKIREYQQTSIMEYSGSFNARFEGLGRYDTAAILYGYGELIEVFENPPAAEAWTQYLAEPSDADPGNFPVQSRRQHPLGFALNKIHHTNFPKLFGGVENIYKRKIVTAASIKDMDKPCTQNDSPYDQSVCGAGSFCQPFSDGFYCTKAGAVEVPYRFCSDEYNWTSPECQTWDEGTDVFDIIDNQIADYEAYWPFRAYRRDNILFNPTTSYYGRIMMDMYGFRKMFEHWALDLARYNHNDWWQTQYGTPWHLDINGGLGRTLAARKIFEYMANMFGRPSDGFYGFNQQRKIYEPVVDNGANTYTNIFQVREDQGARSIYPRYDFDGYIFMPYSAGTFFDRMGAMMFMTYPTTMFTVGVDRTFDLKRFRLNFATIWPQRMHTLLSGIISNSPNLYGWCVEHDGVGPVEGGSGDPIRVKPRMWFGSKTELDAHYDNCTPLNPEPQYDFPQTQYRLPGLAAIYGFGWMSATYDRGFIDRNRLWLKGDGTANALPAGFQTIEYADPFSGKTYVAAYDPAEEDPTVAITPRTSVPTEGDLEPHRTTFWPAARLLAFCNNELARFNGNLSDLSATYQYSRLQEMVGRLEILRGLYRVFDHGF